MSGPTSGRTLIVSEGRGMLFHRRTPTGQVVFARLYSGRRSAEFNRAVRLQVILLVSKNED